MARSNEPIFWSLFSAGGVVTAFLLPIHVLLFGILFPLGAIELSYDRLAPIVTHPIGRIYLFVLISLSLFHAAHRLRFVLADLGLKPIARLLAVVCYGGALVGTILGAWVVIGL